MSTDWSFVVADALEKVLPDSTPRPLDPRLGPTAFAGETVAFQVALRPPAARSLTPVGRVTVELRTEGLVRAEAFRVELVPVALPAFPIHDDGYLRDTPGLYPDLLRPLADGEPFVPLLAGWSSVWIEATPEPGADRDGAVTVILRSADSGDVLFEHCQAIEVVPEQLPELDIVHTEWLHADAIADHYGVTVFSPEHWHLVEAFLAEARGIGMNTLLTPVWTPPLDTAVGHYRTPVQLLDIEDRGDGYTFGFDRLDRWLAMCRRVGIRNLELPPLFTQWGASNAPAFQIRSGGTTSRRFGWDTPADAPEYRALLEQLIPALRRYLDGAWGLDRVFFHVSDEPTDANRAGYGRAREVVADLLDGCTVIDALSDLALVRTGLVDHPVVASDAVHAFAEDGFPPPWVYYCVAQQDAVSNRFIAQPTARTRAIGAQLFAGGHPGFLHWGYCFYYDQHSRHRVDPFADTSAGGAYPGGDSFLVYPGADGRPWRSIRFRAIADAMNDHRLMTLASDRIGRDAVLEALDAQGGWALDRWPRDPEAILRVRRTLVARLRARSGPTAALAGVAVPRG
ncbi:DUF4091 domain-containing protein [uncultured Leifsonia sp.]|uniref:DUF4091 domain-containing protein n=1 Tax=uncultured Leifsonia sp. TaxID=340359 RepID=UPI0028CFEC15|nr:DUF4091 domain-containing protein [uncultured Leifsonia sp.]